MTFLSALRAATADDHVRLDATFGGFDLTLADDYRRFLRAHARALVPIEAAIAGSAATVAWHPRTPMIAADLAGLDEAAPPALPFDPPGDAALWGMRYVIEGSRLGGALLARRVGPGLPAAYLGAHHGKGEWRGFLETLEQAGQAGGEAWRTEAISGARQAFDLFAQGAAQEMISDAGH